MMKKIKNPYLGLKGYNCFGCSPDNKSGLQMEFYEDGDFIISKWQPKEYFQGYNNILHGGIQTTLMDEIASWVVLVKLKTAGVTKKIETRYINPVYTDNGPLTIKASVNNREKNFVNIDVFLYDSGGVLCSKSVATYFVFPESVARDKYFFPINGVTYEE